MTRSDQLLEDIESHGNIGAPEFAARRMYGDSLVQSLIRQKYIKLRNVDIGNGCNYNVLKLMYR